ncbi:MAG: hypothetical protein LBP32_05495 [Spirochaetaceae bacterium]|nr:hypothetical protein [Spirochaetaceae bacterium]
MTKRAAAQSPVRAIFRVLAAPALRKAGIRCLKEIVYNFFFLQYKAALFPRRIPVSRVDHPLDRRIPFSPGWVDVYLDFTAFWIRIAGFILDRYGKKARPAAVDFIRSMGKLYAFAAEVYVKNLSTTTRPRYFANPRFLLIHGFDPHLMCVPSLHVMVMIRSYTQFARMVRSLGDGETLAAQIAEIRRGALAITEAILYVKQHSVNCVSASMYAMTCFDKAAFPPAEAEAFAGEIFANAEDIAPRDRDAVRDHIITLYRRFLGEGKTGTAWEAPLLDFLAALPQKRIP